MTFLFASGAHAETDTVARQIEEKVRAQLEASEGIQAAVPAVELKPWAFDQGGWINYRYYNNRDNDNDRTSQDAQKAFRSLDTRWWFKLLWQPSGKKPADPKHMFYLRLKNAYEERVGAFVSQRYDNVGPAVDYAYLSSQVDSWKVDVGRKKFFVGKGLAYNDVNDGVQVNLLRPGWNLGVFFSRTLPHDDNIDYSVPGYDKSTRRYFSGLGVGYAGIKGQQLYSYGVVQRDHSKERPENEAQDYTYNSEYWGAGVKGEWTRFLNYWIEGVVETGTSRVEGTNEKKAVRAVALDAELHVTPHIRFKPDWVIQYAVGSGDGDRFNVTNTINGNFVGRDRNFLYFGYVPTGFVLSPRLSNLQMLRTGIFVTPFERARRFKGLRVGLEYYRFLIDEPDGAISDPEAVRVSKDVGQEVDVSVEWKMTPRIRASIEYGVFLPGDAYDPSANDREKFASISLTYSF